MAVLDPERAMPRSVLRYRPLTADDQARPSRSVVRPRRHIPDDLEDEREQLPRSRSAPTARREVTPSMRRTRRLHPVFWFGVALLFIVLLVVGALKLVAWGTSTWDDWRYGNPRTFQLDAVLGHDDSPAHPSHLLALNLHGEIIVEEFPGGDVTKARSYILTTLAGQGSDLEVVTLRLIDPTHSGRPDLVITVGDTVSVLVNDQGAFRPPTPAERQQLLPLLQQGQ